MTPCHQIFLLSPANSAGKRAAFLLRKDGRSALAQRLRSEDRGGGATVGEIYTFLSGLYFRGKLAYASAFANPPDGCSGPWIRTIDATPIRCGAMRRCWPRSCTKETPPSSSAVSLPRNISSP